MTKIWYCRNCGYEVTSRGRCHACREKLVPSALPQLAAGPEDEEVGYNIEGWSGPDRGRLIDRLNDLGIIHRFEDEELVVDASDEERVDDLVAMLADGADLGADPAFGGDGELDDLDGSGGWGGPGDLGGRGGPGGLDEEGEPVDPAIDTAVRLLADAAARLKRDPTDMQADADVAEASAAVFIPDRYGPLDGDTWTAVGRVTRKLLALLGAEEALDEQIRAEAAVLQKLLAPVSRAGSTVALGPEGAAALGGAPGGSAGPSGSAGAAGLEGAAGSSGSAGATGLEGAAGSAGSSGSVAGGAGAGDGAASGGPPADGDGAGAGGGAGAGEKTVYELPEWLPEQRAQLGVFLDDAGIGYEWEDAELIVPADRENEVEELFGQVRGVDVDEADEDDEVRYQAVAELFAACGRLGSEPADEARRDAVLDWIERSSGPPLLGMDEVDWFRISSHARTLQTAIETGEDLDLIAREAQALRQMLRALV